MIIARVSQIAIIQNGRVVANKHEIFKLDMLIEELDIPVKELTKIARGVVGREMEDARFLTSMEVKKVMSYLRSKYEELGAKYRRVKWQ